MNGLGAANDAARFSFDIFEAPDGCVVVTLVGELDLSDADDVDAAVTPLLRGRPAHLVVDVSGLSFANSSAIALWVRWATVVGQIEIRQPSERLRGLIERMGLAPRLRIAR